MEAVPTINEEIVKTVPYRKASRLPTILKNPRSLFFASVRLLFTLRVCNVVSSLTGRSSSSSEFVILVLLLSYDDEEFIFANTAASILLGGTVRNQHDFDDDVRNVVEKDNTCTTTLVIKTMK